MPAQFPRAQGDSLLIACFISPNLKDFQFTEIFNKEKHKIEAGAFLEFLLDEKLLMLSNIFLQLINLLFRH